MGVAKINALIIYYCKADLRLFFAYACCLFFYETAQFLPSLNVAIILCFHALTV